MVDERICEAKLFYPRLLPDNEIIYCHAFEIGKTY